MMRSLYSAVSGLKTHQTRMDVIGNNIANVNTEAFKSSSVTFSEIMYQTLSGASAGNGATGTGGVNAKQIGLGVSTGSTSVSIETAGAAETTGNPFDLKLTDSQTTNFFIVSDGTNTMFTRAGSFYVDGNGYLCMSSTGYTLMGWQVDPITGEIRKDTVSALQVMSPGNQTSQPEATQKAYVSGVLDKNDPNLANEEGYVLALSFYDNLGYGYTGKFKVLPAVDESGELKNPGEYTIELTDILEQDGTSLIKDPSDPTGETYLPNLEPGRFFSTGEVAPKTKWETQMAYDAVGTPYRIYNLGSDLIPDLYTIDNYGNIYRVNQTGTSSSSYETAYDADHLEYKLVKDLDGNVSYVRPDKIEDIEVSAANVEKTHTANGVPAWQYTTSDGKTKYYKITDKGLYEVKDTTNSGIYTTSKMLAAEAYKQAGDDVYLTTAPSLRRLGTELQADATTVLTGAPATYTYYQSADGNVYATDGTNVYTTTSATTDGIVTYTTTSTVKYAVVSDDNGNTFYADPTTIIRSNELTTSSVLTDGEPVYKINNKYYTMDSEKNLYEVDTITDRNNWTSDYTGDPAYCAYKDGQNALVYLSFSTVDSGTDLIAQSDFEFSANTIHTVAKEVMEYKPYTVVFDQNNGKFVSCGVDNMAQGSTLSLDMAKIMVNRVVNDDGTTSIYTSADGFTTSNFSNIDIDFTKSMNYNNSGTSTMKALKGDTQGDGTGKKLGALTGLTVDNSGKIYGSYDNGNTVLLCQIACAQFSNASGLEKVGENCYMTTLNSGDFDGIGVEIDADGSSISTGELEMSNVDLSAEFTSMIITQRGFQANSRVITTSDTLLEELINLKR